VRKWQREVLATAPGVHAAIVRTISELRRLPLTGDQPLFVVLSREQAKLSYRWSPGSTRAAGNRGRPAVERRGRRAAATPLLSACFEPVLDDEGLPLEQELERKKQRCGACGDPLWQADRTGPRRFPLADYIGRRLPGSFDLLIVDEQHECAPRGAMN